MKNIILISSLIFFFGLQVFAGNDNDNNSENKANGIISGKVVDQITGEGLSGVKVSLNNGVVSYTDLEGNFFIEVNGNKTYQIQANFISYQSYTLNNLIVDSGENQVIRLELKTIED